MIQGLPFKVCADPFKDGPLLDPVIQGRAPHLCADWASLTAGMPLGSVPTGGEGGGGHAGGREHYFLTVSQESPSSIKTNADLCPSVLGMLCRAVSQPGVAAWWFPGKFHLVLGWPRLTVLTQRRPLMSSGLGLSEIPGTHSSATPRCTCLGCRKF